MRHQLPFNPTRDSLYTGLELLGGFDPSLPSSYETTLDFRTYRYFVKEGRYAPKNYFDGMMQSLHDNSVTQALRDFLIERERVVAIMGGHKLKRDSEGYKKVTIIARKLSHQGYLVTSGGGPGAMEAALPARLSERR